MTQHELLIYLEAAVQCDDLDEVRRALDAGADPNGFEEDPLIRPPMVESALGNFVASMQLLHQRGGRVDGPLDYARTTPLIAACLKGHAEACRWLLRHGADPMKKGELGTHALEVAINYGHVRLAQIMVNECPQLKREPLTTVAPKVIADSCNPAMVEWLLHMGADANLVVEDRSWLMKVQTPTDKFGASTDLLLQAGADINFQAADGRTALHHAVGMRSHQGFMRLLRAGASTDIPGPGGRTLRQQLAQRSDEKDMYDLLIAWESSQAAHQAIDHAAMQTDLRPL